MAEQYLVKKSDLDDIANSIQAKAGVSGGLVFPEGFKSTVESIPTGGGENYLPAVVDGSITEITAEMLAGVTSIRKYAFYSCTQLTSVKLPDTVSSISDYAFGGCSALSELKIPDNISSIGESAFWNAGIKEFTWFSHLPIIPKYCFQSAKLERLVIPEGVTEVSNYAFNGCESLVDITLPSTLTTIGSAAFNAIGANGKIHIPNLTMWLKLTLVAENSLTLDNGRALYVNGEPITDFSSVTAESGVTSIKNHTFRNTSMFADLVIPSYILSIGQYAFFNIETNSIDFEEGCTTLSNYAFQYHKAKTVTLPASMKTVGNYAFSTGENLTTVTFRGTPTTINSRSFNACSKLKNIYVPWAEGEVANAPWGATNATIHYGTTKYTATVGTAVSAELSFYTPDDVANIYLEYPDGTKVDVGVYGDNFPNGIASGISSTGDSYTEGDVVYIGYSWGINSYTFNTAGTYLIYGESASGEKTQVYKFVVS